MPRAPRTLALEGSGTQNARALEPASSPGAMKEPSVLRFRFKGSGFKA